MQSQRTITDRLWPGLALVAAVALLLGVSCGGGGSDGAASLGFPITLERADGQAVTFDASPQRIVSLSPGHTEVLFAIGAGDRVVAVDSGSDFPAGTDDLPKFDALSPDMEALADLDPDIVLVMGGPEGVVNSLDGMGFPVLWLALPRSVSDLLSQIDHLGAITARLEQSDELVDEIDGRFLEVLEEVGDSAGPRVYHELDEDLTTVSTDTFIGEMYLVLNAVTIADDAGEPFPQLTENEIVEADPEVIIIAHEDASPESVAARPGWEGIAAVEGDQVFIVDPAIVNRPGPRLVEGLERLGELLHPDLFSER